MIFNSKKDIYGIKLKHLDCLPEIVGGELLNNEFSIKKTSKIFEANYNENPIPKGIGVFIEFNGPIYQSCLDQLVIYEDAGWVLSHEFYPVYGCMDSSACNFNPRANNKDKSCDYPPKHYDCNNNCISKIDCSGVCGGEKNIDECGICDGDNSSCSDCAGTPNGSAYKDECGICDDDDSNDCTQDCSGTWGGNKIIDECDICGGDNSSCADCAGIPNGTAFMDDCDICSSGTTNHIANSNKDCFGMCFGKTKLDCAGICGGTTKIDCFDICDGKSKLDRCGICDGDNTSCGATYLWPTDASKTVTAFFGEERPNRYHAGLDIRTYGKVGDKLFATSDGYIKKITVSTKGYGKALYLQLDDGNVALYAHLNNFTKEIDDIVKSLQKKHDKYSLYYTFDPDEFRVKKGDVIGYSGDTGTISGPHIHYELRDSLGKPFNPLYEYEIIDNKSPIVNQIAFIPLDFETKINELSKTQTFEFKRITSNIYELKDTIAVDGKFGLGINVIDKVNSQPFSYGVYKIELYIDEQKSYEVSYDIYDYKDAQYIYHERDYQLKVELGKTFYRLFSGINKEMLFINPEYSIPYILFGDNKYHDFKIVISDFNNNKVYASGTILNKKMPIIYTKHNQNSLSFDNILEDKYQYQFHITGKNDLDKVFVSNDTYFENNIINWESTEKPFSVLKIDIKSNDGTQYLPQYIQIINDDTPVTGKFHLKHYEHGVILEFKTEEFINKIPQLTYEKDGYRKSLKMHRIAKNSFETPLIKPSEFSQYNNIEIHFDTEPKYVFKYDIANILAIPNKKIKLLHNGGQTIVRGNKYTFNDTTLVWIKEHEQLSNDTVTLTKPILIGPNRLQFNKFVELIIRVPKREDLDYSSIYKYNKNTNKWKYIPSTIDKEDMSLICNIDSGGIYAIIKEKQSPLVSNIYPGNNASYYQHDFREIKFSISDDGSGIKDEKNIIVQIDNEKPLIFEYNTYRKEVYYKLDQKMTEGKHELRIEAFDNVGNKTLRKHKFYIKK